ncbi:hypothetical protein OH77DRAFT_593520 [Trametes cingulata]|nr:hypothetical protein OH77DRAFT_593520 [Trametes cingulata]
MAAVGSQALTSRVHNVHRSGPRLASAPASAPTRTCSGRMYAAVVYQPCTACTVRTEAYVRVPLLHKRPALRCPRPSPVATSLAPTLPSHTTSDAQHAVLDSLHICRNKARVRARSRNAIRHSLHADTERAHRSGRAGSQSNADASPSGSRAQWTHARPPHSHSQTSGLDLTMCAAMREAGSCLSGTPGCHPVIGDVQISSVRDTNRPW